MSSTLSIGNFGNLNVLEVGVLDADVAADATDITLQNPQNFTTNSFIVIGILGSEGAEIAQIASVSDRVATLANALALPHNKFDKVTRVFGNQIKIYTAPNVDGTQPADAAFSALSGGLTDLDTDQLNTRFTDPDGSSDVWYKSTYYNSTESTETSLSDSKSARGNGYGNYCSVFAIRENAGFKNNRNISDALIDQHRLAAQQEINGRLAARYVVPFTAPINEYVSSMTKRLSAGFLLVEQYGAYTVQDTNNGETRIKEVRAELKELQEGNMTLVGETGVDIASGNGGFDGLPNDDTYNATSGTGGHMFSVNDVGGHGKY